LSSSRIDGAYFIEGVEGFSVRKEPGYGPTAKILHWLTVSLLVVQYPVGWLMPKITPDMVSGLTLNVHMSFGLVILFLMFARFLWRLSHSVSPEGTLPTWQRISSGGVHLLLYLLILTTTLTGWTFASVHGWPIRVFGVLALPPLVAKGSALGGAIGDLHPMLIWILLAAIVGHVAAALVHLFVYRDRMMQRMLPGAG
jgi:cytochrome b561